MMLEEVVELRERPKCRAIENRTVCEANRVNIDKDATPRAVIGPGHQHIAWMPVLMRETAFVGLSQKPGDGGDQSDSRAVARTWGHRRFGPLPKINQGRCFWKRFGCARRNRFPR